MISVEVSNRSGVEVEEEAAAELARSVLGGEGVEDGELGQGQLVERAQHGGTGGRSGRQLRRVLGGRRGQVRALAEQPGEPVVGPPPQLLGQGA